MSAQRLRDAAKVLRERADAVRRPFSQQERLHHALADWIDGAGADYFAFGDDEHHAPDHEPCDDCDSDPRAPHLRHALRVADLILGAE